MILRAQGFAVKQKCDWKTDYKTNSNSDTYVLRLSVDFYNTFGAKINSNAIPKPFWSGVGWGQRFERPRREVEVDQRSVTSLQQEVYSSTSINTTCLQHSYEICVLWSMLQEVWSYFGLDEIECLLDVFITWITYSSVVIVARTGFRGSQTAFLYFSDARVGTIWRKLVQLCGLKFAVAI